MSPPPLVSNYTAVICVLWTQSSPEHSWTPGDVPSGLEELLGRPSFRQFAACRGVDPSVFFPARGESTTQAKAICSTCPVEPECLGEALRDDALSGIWGGTSERARRKLRREMAVPNIELFPCRHCCQRVPRLSAMRLCPPCDHFVGAYGCLPMLRVRKSA